jgi:hypothetical protein
MGNSYFKLVATIKFTCTKKVEVYNIKVHAEICGQELQSENVKHFSSWLCLVGWLVVCLLVIVYYQSVACHNQSLATFNLTSRQSFVKVIIMVGRLVGLSSWSLKSI